MSFTTLQLHNISPFFHFVYTFFQICDKIMLCFNKRKEKNIMFDKDTIIGDILEQAPDKADILLEVGMHCLSCPAALGETLEEACEVHGIDVNEVLEMLNK